MPTFAYVANDNNKVSVIDTSNNTVINTISVLSPDNIVKAIAITPDGRYLYVTNLSNVVAVIDTWSNTIVTTITVGDFPAGIAVTPDGKYVYVANSGLETSTSGTVSVIDTTTNLVIATIPVGRDPVGVAITPDGNFVYITNAKSDNVSVIDTATNTVVTTIAVGDFPQGIAITPNGNFAYVANQGQSSLSNTVSVINLSTNTEIATITVGLGPTNIAITPNGNFVYVTNVGDNTVSVIDVGANTVIKSIPVGPCPFGIAITPDGGFAYVTRACDNKVAVIATNTNTVVDTITVGNLPLGVAIGNINFPCPAPLDRMCIETTRIFDSCMFNMEKTIKIPVSNKIQRLQCEVLETKCSILNVTKIDEQQSLVDVKLQIKVVLRITNRGCNNSSFKKVVCFNKNVTLMLPEGGDLSCEINNATCECNGVSEGTRICCNNNSDCTVKVTATVKSKKLVQVEVPFLRSCESKQCSSNGGIKIVPGRSYPLPSVPSEINSIKFLAKTDTGMTSQVVILLNGQPLTFVAVTEELKSYKLDLPGGPYPVGSLSLKNLGTSSIYIRNLTTE